MNKALNETSSCWDTTNHRVTQRPQTTLCFPNTQDPTFNSHVTDDRVYLSLYSKLIPMGQLHGKLLAF